MSEELLDERLVNGQVKLVMASKDKRLMNFIVDYLAIILFVGVFYEFLAGMGYRIEPSENTLQNQLQGSLFYLTYYVFIEGVMEGRSLGKMATKTRVVTPKGEVPQVKDIIARSIFRIVPFEPFSFLGDRKSGWHDRWSKTIVIDESQSVLPEESKSDWL